jgi:hypothetical protein
VFEVVDTIEAFGYDVRTRSLTHAASYAAEVVLDVFAEPAG